MKNVKRNSKLLSNLTLDTDVENISSEISKVQANLIHDDSLYSELKVVQNGDHTYTASRVVPPNAPIGEHIVEWRVFFMDQTDPLIQTEKIEVVRDVKPEITVSSKMMKEPVVNDTERLELLPADIAALIKERV